VNPILHPPAFLSEAARRTWWSLWLDHGCDMDAPDLTPHYCAIRSLLLQDDVIERWQWLGARWAELEGPA
jgi:hypothetical protein